MSHTCGCLASHTLKVCMNVSTDACTGHVTVRRTADTSRTAAVGGILRCWETSTCNCIFSADFPVACLMLLPAWNLDGGQAVNSVESTCCRSRSRWLMSRPMTQAHIAPGSMTIPNFEVLPLGSKGNNTTGEWVGYLPGSKICTMRPSNGYFNRLDKATIHLNLSCRYTWHGWPSILHCR